MTPPPRLEPVDGGLVRPSGIGEILISSRSLAEYRAMFALTDADLARRILDCPAGTASFTAEANAVGENATACDLVYADGDLDDLAARSLAETERGNRYVRAHPEEYRWSYFADPDEHQRSRLAAGARFAADIRRHPHRYIAGRLPELPSPTRASISCSARICCSATPIGSTSPSTGE